MAVDDVQMTGPEVMGQCDPAVREATAARGAIVRGLPSDRAQEL